ncbi:hypothetical protein JCM3774_002987, partial [Rhodotorula dairenensis]
MPPALSPELDELASFFQRCGLSEQRATETARSKGAPAARDLFAAAHLDDEPVQDKQGALVLQLAKDGAKLSTDAQLYIVSAIRDGRLLKSDQITGKSAYLGATVPPVDDKAFDEACGVGFSITSDELDARVRAYLDSPDNADQVKTGWTGISRVTGVMRQSDSLRWVAPLDLKSAVEKAYTERFGSKEEAAKKAKAQAEQAKKV